ncbi:MAG TPA: leucyl/phenylalanyl-tRNA--protein transferase [Thermodesulfobacteriota bacterium]
MTVFFLNNSLVFPDPRCAESDGLVAVGGDLRIERLILAYQNGIFPWYSEGYPILWFSPDPRLIMFPDQLRVSRSLRRVINSGVFEVRFDTCFEEAIIKCATVSRKNQDATWITNDMIDAYILMHNEGFAHSVETFYQDKLVGGLYGVSLGGAFFGESMFHLMSNASKVALYHLVEKLKLWGFDFIDSQIATNHMKSLGAGEIDRESFLGVLKSTLKRKTRRGNWNTEC